MMVGRKAWSLVSRVRASFRDTGGDEAPLFSGQIIPESYRAGSDYFTSEKPKCQLTVWVRSNGDRWDVSESAWRYQNYLVTTLHGCPNPQDFALSRGNNDPIPVQGDVIVCQDDVLVIQLTPTVWSKLGVSTATIASYDGGFVRVTGIETHLSTSVGILHKTDILGKFTYTGSTRPGHSGAPYVVGTNQVVAMHMAGGTQNLAVNANYIKSLIERPQIVKPERITRKSGVIPEARFYNDDWYVPDDEGNTDYTSRRSRGNPDEYEVEYGGKYYVMDDDEYTRFNRHINNIKRKHRPQHNTRDYYDDDYYPECREDVVYGPSGLRRVKFEPCPKGKVTSRGKIACPDLDSTTTVQPECVAKIKDTSCEVPAVDLTTCHLGEVYGPGEKCDIELEELEAKRGSFLGKSKKASSMSEQPNRLDELFQQQAETQRLLNTMVQLLQSNLSPSSQSQTSPPK